MTIDMKKTNRKQSDKRTTMIVKHLEENSGFQDNTDQYEFKCKTCKRRFKTYQALGGHKSSHKKIKPKNKYNYELCMLSLNTIPTVSYRLYQCKICLKEFETGQKLGGHMRTHRLGKGLNVVEENGLSRQEAVKEKVENDLESGSSVLTMVELERRKAEEDERVRVRRELILAAKEWRLFLES